jgi:cytochrome P450
MPNRVSSQRFRREPLAVLEQSFAETGQPFWLPGRQLCVAEPSAARAILANDGGLYQEHSDFFHTRRGAFGPRSVQVRMGRAARDLLRAHAERSASELPARVRQDLVPVSDWPDAGNRFFYRHFAAVLASPESPRRLMRTLDEIVERSILAGARERGSRLGRALYRARALREVAQAIANRRRQAPADGSQDATGEDADAPCAPAPKDLLDVIAAAATPTATPAELAEIFVSFLFAVTGSVGFVLGWSLFLLGTHLSTDVEPAWVVREALRLWPVAWMLGRRPAQAHRVSGVTVTPEDQVVVCPYLLHRDAHHWEDPGLFRPERWATVADHRAFLPFGWGPHRCVAAALAMQLVEDVLRILAGGYQLNLTLLDPQPSIGPALAPPRFTLRLTPRC